MLGGAILEAVRDIRKKEAGHFVEPYWFWLHGPGADLQGAIVNKILDVFVLRSVVDPARGIAQCGSTSADLEQFFNHIDPASRFNNIPVVADVLGNGFTLDQDSAMCFTPTEKWASTLPSIADEPCKTVRYDSVQHALRSAIHRAWKVYCAKRMLASAHASVTPTDAFECTRDFLHC
ncbi:MAG: hypothetical protein IPP33_16840 [Flavobacteriales bacterium]|nr:hypothetical protein [Flavobacteriales bacterium]